MTPGLEVTGLVGDGLVALAVVMAVLITGCSPTSSPDSTGVESGLISIDEGYPPHVRCMIESGFRLVSVDEPEADYGSTGYEFESDLPQEEALRILRECRELAPDPPPITNDELRVIYDRWVKERDCLRDLGYVPAEPPSFEKFAEDWRSPPPESGPWDPLAGVDTGAWTDAEFRVAKERCVLEFFDRS